MKKSLKKFSKVETYCGYTILVYGELWEEGYVDGVIVHRAKFSKDGRRVMDVSSDREEILLNRPYTRTRYFNMGWAICSPEDKFNEEYGIELCKKRFRKSPLKTETGLFLTKDMINALIENEVNYIKKNWAKFAPNTILLSEKPFVEPTKNIVDEFINKKEEEPASYTEGQLTELEKITRPTATFDNEEAQKVNEAENEDNTVATPVVTPGSYVRVLCPSKANFPFTVAYVKDVDEDGVNCLWLIKYGENFSSFRVNNTYLSNKEYLVRAATKEETSDALKAIESKTSFHWNVSEKRLEAKFI